MPTCEQNNQKKMVSGRYIKADKNGKQVNCKIVAWARSDERRKFLFSQLELTLPVGTTFLYRLP